MSEDDPISVEDGARIIDEVVRAAGPDGIDHHELKKAYDAMLDIACSAGMWHLWQEHKVTIRWNEAEQDLMLKLRDTTEGKPT